MVERLPHGVGQGQLLPGYGFDPDGHDGSEGSC
jgi:hypothetical protein